MLHGLHQQELGDVGQGREDGGGQKIHGQGREGSSVRPGQLVDLQGDAEEVDQAGCEEDVDERVEVGHEEGEDVEFVLSGEVGKAEDEPAGDLDQHDDE